MTEAAPDRVLVPRAPALVAGFRETLWLSADGEIEALSPEEARARLDPRPTAASAIPIVCHARAVARRLDLAGFAALDILELFAFVRPARFCVPTPRGIAAALGLPPPRTMADACVALIDAARALLRELQADDSIETRALAEIAERAGWGWGPAVLAALPPAEPAATRRAPTDQVRGLKAHGLRVWQNLPEWQERAPPPPPGNDPVSPDEARQRLASLLGAGAEAQAAAGRLRRRGRRRLRAARAAPTRRAPCSPRPGPASERPSAISRRPACGPRRTRATVWLSTYTRNLQSQIDGELDRLYPDPAQKRRRVVIRKGRENFLCLLNYEDAARAASARTGPSAAALVLIARWASATASGDLAAGDFPGWLAELIGRARINSLADRRGECIHSACPHFRRCFIEKNVRAARHARLVVANHALVMAQAALGGLDDAALPTRYVFDEGHHLLDAADAAFSVRLSGQEGRELRRWLLGAEAGRSRARGLRRRIGDLVEADEEAEAALVEALVAVPHPAGRLLAPAARRGASRCPASRRFWRWSGVRCWRAPRPATRAIGIEAEARPPIEGLTESADAARRRSRPAVGGAAPPRRLPAAPARRPGEPARCGGCVSGSTRSCAASNAAPSCSSAAGARCCAISASRRGRKRSNGWRSSGSTGPRPISPSTATGSTPASRSRRRSRNRRTVSSSPRRR